MDVLVSREVIGGVMDVLVSREVIGGVMDVLVSRQGGDRSDGCISVSGGR